MFWLVDVHYQIRYYIIIVESLKRPWQLNTYPGNIIASLCVCVPTHTIHAHSNTHTHTHTLVHTHVHTLAHYPILPTNLDYGFLRYAHAGWMMACRTSTNLKVCWHSNYITTEATAVACSCNEGLSLQFPLSFLEEHLIIIQSPIDHLSDHSIQLLCFMGFSYRKVKA